MPYPTKSTFAQRHSTPAHVPHVRRRSSFHLRRRHRRLLYFAGGVVLLFVLPYLAREPILRGAAHAWLIDERDRLEISTRDFSRSDIVVGSSEDPLAPATVQTLRATRADAIVILAGSVETRPLEAAKLFKQGYAPLIILTDIPAREGLRTPGEDYLTGTLGHWGVSFENILIRRTGVLSTFDEAESIRDWCVETRSSRVIVVTDAFHTRRAKWIFNRVFEDTGFEAVFVAAPPNQYELDAWWKSEFGLVDFNNEVLKYIFYQWNY